VAPTVTLYRRRLCGLCDDALFELRALGRELAFRIVERDIDADADLRARYDEVIPVIALGEIEIARAPVDASVLRAALEAAIKDRGESS
jgi:hypothetical protein